MLSPAAFSSSTSSGPSSSSSIEERENPARVSASVVDMGHSHESNKVNGNVLPPERNHQNQLRQSLKLLTLPTILTLARVAAIPVFIGSKSAQFDPTFCISFLDCFCCLWRERSDFGFVLFLV